MTWCSVSAAMMVASHFQRISLKFLTLCFASYAVHLHVEASSRASLINLLTVERGPPPLPMRSQTHKILTLRGSTEVDLLRQLCEGHHRGCNGDPSHGDPSLTPCRDVVLRTAFRRTLSHCVHDALLVEKDFIPQLLLSAGSGLYRTLPNSTGLGTDYIASSQLSSSNRSSSSRKTCCRHSCLCALKGKCRNFYNALFYGVSGSFSRADVSCIQRCLGPRFQGVEGDGPVYKAEGHGPSTLQWLRGRGGKPSPVVTEAGSGREGSGPADLEGFKGGANRGQGRTEISEGDVRSGIISSSGGDVCSGDRSSSGDDRYDNSSGGGITWGMRFSVDGAITSVPQDHLEWLVANLGKQAEERLREAEAAASSGRRISGNTSGAVSLEQMAQSTVLPPPSSPQGPSSSSSSSSSSAAAAAAAATADASNRRSRLGGRYDVRPDVTSVDVLEHSAACGPLLRTPGPKCDRLDPALWNLDRIDQRAPPLDGLYSFGSETLRGVGRGVTIYSVDSGVFAEHNEFLPWPDDDEELDGVGEDVGEEKDQRDVGNVAATEGGGDEQALVLRKAKSSRATYGYDFVDGDDVAADCDGHGTHVASSAVGRSVGVARGSRLVAVRVLDCYGSGTIADTVAGLDWVARNARLPAVAMLSLGVPAGSWSNVLAESVRKLVRRNGIVVVVASGNSAVDSCLVVPANVPEVLTVAASNLEHKFGSGSRGGRETLYDWANTGACVDVIAPGVEVFGACGGTDRCDVVTPGSYTWASGTSMAAPLVAGVAALYLEAQPEAKPEKIVAELLWDASEGVVLDDRMLPGTPNRLLYSRLDKPMPTRAPKTQDSEEEAKLAPPVPPSATGVPVSASAPSQSQPPPPLLQQLPLNP